MIPVNTRLKTYTLEEAGHVKIHGRINGRPQPLPLFFTGSGVELNVTGSELWIDLEVDCDVHEPWIYTALNGAFMSRQMLLPGSYSLCLFRNMSPEAVKNIKFLRELQAMPEDEHCRILVHGFRSDGNFLPVADKPYMLEFIGDSITSGEGTYGAVGDTDWLAMYMSGSQNYAVMCADALHADYHLISQCGWGVYCGWDNNPDCNVPSRYEKVCGFCKGEANDSLGAFRPYSFENRIPDAVIVNLGTNDAGAFNQPAFTDPATGISYRQRKNPDGSFAEEDLAKVKKAIIEFLQMIRRHNPSSHIVWVYGMLGYDLTLTITDALHTYRKETGDNNAAFLQLPNTTEETLGAHGHPGIESHKRAAKVLTEYLQSVL